MLKWLVNYFFSFDVRRKFPELSSSNHLTTAKTLLRLITGGKKTLGWGFPCSPLGSILQRFLTWRKTRAIYIRRKRHLGQKKRWPLRYEFWAETTSTPSRAAILRRRPPHLAPKAPQKCFRRLTFFSHSTGYYLFASLNSLPAVRCVNFSLPIHTLSEMRIMLVI